MAVVEMNIKSEVLNKSTSLSIALPENDVLGSELSVLYLLHGLGDDHTKWLRRTTIESLIKRIPLIVVMPNVEKSFYTRVSNGDDYWEFLTSEVFELIENLFRISHKKEKTFIAGNSMGGFGALKYAVNFPERFQSAYSFSAVTDVIELFDEHFFDKYKALDAFKTKERIQNILHATFGNKEKIENSENDIFHKVNELEKESFDLSIYCGSEDPLVDMNRKLSHLLSEKEIPHQFKEFSGGHDWKVWQESIEYATKDIVENYLQ